MKSNTSPKSSGKDNDKSTSELKNYKSQKSSGKDNDKAAFELNNNTSQHIIGKDNDKPTLELESNTSQKSSGKDDKPESELKSNTSLKSSGNDNEKPTSGLKHNIMQKLSGKDNDKHTSFLPKSSKSQKSSRKDDNKPTLGFNKSQKGSGKDNDKPTSETKGNHSQKSSGKHGDKCTSYLINHISHVSALSSSIMQSAANEFKGLEEKCFIHAKCCPQQLQHYKHVSGTFHQGDDKYSAESRGNQCACIDWNTLCFSTSKSASTWQRDDTDSLLNAGDKMYRDLGFIGYPYVEDLPKEVAFRDKHYKISILKTYTGGLCSADSSDGIFYVLRDSLDLCFTARRHAMMVCKYNAIAMFKDNFGYYILDSHARSSQGLIDPNGTAVLLMFKTLTDLHKGILRLFNSISSVHCETAYSLTELEICIDGEQWNIGHSSLVQLYLEKQAKMKEQKINTDKKGQKEKSEKNLTAAAMRKRKSRQNSNYRATEQESDTARRMKKRKDSTIRAKEQEYNTARRKAMRTDSAIRAAEQESDTSRRKRKREDPAISATEKEYNTAKRKEMREDPAMRAAEQESDTLRRKTKRENPAIAATEKEYNTAKRKEMREDPAMRAAEQESDTLRIKTKR